MKKKLFVGIFVLLLAVMATASCITFTRAQEAYAITETVYIESEADFLSFVSDCKQDATKLQRVTYGKRYILCTDIYLTRYNDPNGVGVAELFFNGEFDGNGHAIVGYKGSRAFFARITPSATVKNVSFIGTEITVTQEDGIVATENLGTISGITVTGKAVGDAVAGICAYNYGTISDSVVMVELESEEGNAPEYAAAIALSNTSRAIERIEDDYSNYVGVYSIENTRHPSSDGYESVLEKDDDYVEPAEDLIADGKIESYTELLWYMHAYAYAQTNQTTLPTASQMCYINLYNAEIGALKSTFNDVIADDRNFNKNYCGYYNATAVIGDDYISNYSNCQLTTVPIASADLEGSGTKAQPYLVYDIGDLVALADKTEFAYVSLMCDIDLAVSGDDFYKPSDENAFIPAFNGIFDGNGHSISGIVDCSLFGSITAESAVKNVTVIGKSSGALFIQTCNGTVKNVAVYGKAPYAFGSASGTITRCDISVDGAVAGELLNGATITYTRNRGEEFVLSSEEKVTVKNVQNVSDTSKSVFNANAVNSVSYDSTGIPTYTADTNSYSLVKAEATGATHTVSDGWKFGYETSWGFIKNGKTDDIPALVFPYDNVSYKMISVFDNGADAEGTYGAIQSSNSFIVSSGSSEAVSKDYIENLIIEGADDLNGSYLDGLPLSVRKALVADNVKIGWILSNGKEHTADGFDYGKGDRKIEIYLETSYYYIGGELVVDSDNVCTVTYDCIRYGVDSAYLVGKFGFDGLKAVFADVYGFELDENYSHAIDFDGVSIEFFKDDEVYSSTFVTTPDTYVMRVTVSPTADYTGAVFEGKYVVSKGEANFDEYEISSSLGGITSDDAPIYNGYEIKPSFTLSGLRRAGVSYEYNIESFARNLGGQPEIMDMITDAGVYTLSLTVRLPGYEAYTRTFDFYVGRKEAVVTPSVKSIEVTFGSAHPEVIFNSETLNDFSGIGYTSDYTRFSGPGRYNVSLSVDESKVNPNYVVVNGKDATFTVVQAEMDYKNCGFDSVETVYDGTAHGAILDVKELKTLSGDTQTYTYTIIYKYGENSSSEPFAFTNVGEYLSLSVTVTAEPQNYKPFTISGVKIKITPLELVVSANDVYVNYNAEPVYTISVDRADGGEALAENYADNLTLGVDYRVGSSYQKGQTQAGAQITVTAEIINEYVGNYRLVRAENATLTVGKRRYALNVKTEYEYTGLPVVLDYNGEEVLAFEDGYPKYYYVRGGVVNPMEGAPQNANDSTLIYRVEIVTKETSEYYSCSTTVDFSIISASVTVGSLMLYDGSSVTEFTGAEVVYNKTGYRVDIDKSALPSGASFIWKYTYEAYDEISLTWTTESVDNIAPTFVKPIKVRNFTVTATDNDGNYNDLYIELPNATLIVNPKKLVLSAPTDLVYRGADGFDKEAISEIVDGLDFITEYAPVIGDHVSYEIECADSAVLPGEYTVKVVSNGPEYEIEDVKVKIVCAEITIEFEGIRTFEYGTLFNSSEGLPSFTYTFRNSSIGEGDHIITMRVGCSKHQTSYIAPGEYSVVSADSIVKEGVECVRFTVSQGEQKVKVYPKTVTFDRYNISSSLTKDGIADEYVYGEISVIYNSVPRLKVTGIMGNDDPEIKIVPDREVKHVGTYTFTAVANMEIPGEELDANGNPVGVKCYRVQEDIASFTTVVKPKEILYSIAECRMYADEDLPSVFTAEYEGADGATEQFTVVDYVKGAEGAFKITLDLYNVENGIRYNDYIAIKRNVGAEELVVAQREFSQDLVAIDTEVTYSGNPVEVSVVGLPEDAEVSQSLYPVNAGRHSVTVTVSKSGFKTVTFDVIVIIRRATPYITQDEVHVEYVSKHVLGEDDVVNARAEFNGVAVAGKFTYTETFPKQTQMYGTYTYKIDFTPDDTVNFNPVKNVGYTMTSYVNKEEVSIDLGDTSSDVLTGVGEVKVGSLIPEKYRGAVQLYVNGDLVGEEYTFTETEEDILLELRLDNEVLYSKVISIKITTGGTVVRPTEPSVDNRPSATDTNFAVVDEEKTRMWIIIGSVVGGVAVVGGVVAIVIVVLKRKGKLGGNK